MFLFYAHCRRNVKRLEFYHEHQCVGPMCVFKRSVPIDGQE